MNDELSLRSSRQPLQPAGEAARRFIEGVKL
jgi:hypothetical protein